MGLPFDSWLAFMAHRQDLAVEGVAFDDHTAARLERGLCLAAPSDMPV